MVVQRFSVRHGRAVRFSLEIRCLMTINPEEPITCKLCEKSGGGGQRVAYSETADAYQLEEEH